MSEFGMYGVRIFVSLLRFLDIALVAKAYFIYVLDEPAGNSTNSRFWGDIFCDNFYASVCHRYRIVCR